MHLIITLDNCLSLVNKGAKVLLEYIQMRQTFILLLGRREEFNK